MLVNSGKGVSSHSEYYSLLPVLESVIKLCSTTLIILITDRLKLK
jgi:hypothetical protein